MYMNRYTPHGNAHTVHLCGATASSNVPKEAHIVTPLHKLHTNRQTPSFANPFGGCVIATTTTHATCCGAVLFRVVFASVSARKSANDDNDTVFTLWVEFHARFSHVSRLNRVLYTHTRAIRAPRACVLTTRIYWFRRY